MKNSFNIKQLKRMKKALIAGSMVPLLAGTTVNAEDDILYLDKIGNPTYYEDAIDLLKSLPYHLNDYLNDIQAHAVLVESPYGADDMYASYYGSYSPNSITGFVEADYPYTIYIEGGLYPGYYERYSDCTNGLTEDEFSKEIVMDSLLHELGHRIDLEHDYYGLSSSFGFREIYYEEVDNFMQTTHYNQENLKAYANIDSPIEYFASTFSSFFRHSQDLKEKCPLTYDYFQNLMKEIDSYYSNQYTK